MYFRHHQARRPLLSGLRVRIYICINPRSESSVGFAFDALVAAARSLAALAALSLILVTSLLPARTAAR
jgi:hypothetical protein